MELMTGEQAANWDRKFQKKQAAKPQQSGGGLVGFLQNAGKSFASDFQRVGQGTANVLHELTGGAQRERDQQSQRNQEDIKLIQSYGKRIRSAKTPQEKERYKGALRSLMQTSDKSDEDFRNRQAEIIEQNDPLKGAAAVGGIGLDVLGGGVGGSILKSGLLKGIGKAAGQGALFGGAQGALQPVKEKGGQASLEDIVGNAASGAGVGALTGGAVGGAAGVGSKLFNKLSGKQVQFNAPTQMDGRPSMLSRAGKRLTESGSGLKADTTVGGVKNLDEQAEFMSKYTGTPRQQRVAMEKDMVDLSKQVDDILAKNNKPIKGVSLSTRLKEAIDDPNTFPELDITSPRTQTLLQKNMSILSSKNDAKSLNDFVKTLNATATSARDKLANATGRALTPNETAALATKRVIDEELKNIPEIAPLKQNMAQIFDVTPQVARAGEKSIGVPMVQGMNIKGPVQAFKGLQSVLGAAAQKSSKKVDQKALARAFQPDETGQLTSPDVSKMGAARGAFGGLVNPMVSRDAALAEPEQPPVDTLESEEIPTTNPENGASIFTKDNIQALILQDLAANDGKNVNTLLALYKAFGEQVDKPLSAEASKVIANANSGLKSLDRLEGIIEEQGGVSPGTLVPGRELLGGAGAALLGTGEYDTAARNLKDVITRLRTGAALTEQEAAFYESQIPQAFDSPETRDEKLGLFRDLFSSVANRTGSAGTDLQSSL